MHYHKIHAFKELNLNKFQNKQRYENIAMKSPDGHLMCYIGLKRANWYVNRNLAHYNNEKEIIIRINDCALGAFEDEIEKGRSTNSMINEYFDKYLSEYRLALLKVKTLKPFL